MAARLTMRTRISTCVFFIASISLIYYINIDNCNANIELWLGIGPMYIAMTTLLLAEALLYSPSPPQQAAVKLHSSLQQFSWTEAGAPAVLAKRGHPSEPLFCFETALKACYFCLHSYRHFRVSCAPNRAPPCLDGGCLSPLEQMPSHTLHNWSAA